MVHSSTSSANSNAFAGLNAGGSGPLSLQIQAGWNVREAGRPSPGGIRRRVSDLAEAVTEEIEKGVQVPGNPPDDAVAPIAEALSLRASVAALKLLEA